MGEWDLLEIDVLKEIGTIAAGHGSDILNKMLNKNIKVYLPSVVPLDNEYLLKEQSDKSNMVSVQCDIVAGLHGRLLLTFDERSAIKFLSICYPQYQTEENGFFNELGLSALKEIGNVVLSAYVNALSIFLKSVIVPSPPILLMGALPKVIEIAMISEGKIFILLIDTVFEKEHEQIKGRMEFLLTKEDKNILQESCRSFLDNNKNAEGGLSDGFGGIGDIVGK